MGLDLPDKFALFPVVLFGRGGGHVDRRGEHDVLALYRVEPITVGEFLNSRSRNVAGAPEAFLTVEVLQVPEA